ncbi:MAG: manganese-dependent inorganic pyrophosphatase [Actinomycetes bacterium]|jgi:manganese-dependent inorganic pyrophosphatase|nr:manganese-dependent inorganic pyrophosphatase [Actinomycetes bacterium]
MANIYVFGHKNPDNDSICSAAAYTWYLNQDTQEGECYVSTRLGAVPPETAWLFEQFGATEELPAPLPEFGADDPAPAVILVDHNEYSQSADGIEDMDIREVVDHHRIGGIVTAQPISFVNLPYGSTATVIAEHFMESEIPMPTWVAGILLGALLTDTVILKSPTTTEVDREICEVLSEALELDPIEFGMTLFKQRSAATPFQAAAVLTNDLKEYKSNGKVIGIVQYENVDLDDVNEHRENIFASMKQIATSRGYDVFAFMATDIMREGTELFVVGETAFAETAFEVDFSTGSCWMPGVLSRKKQVAAAFMGV